VTGETGARYRNPLGRKVLAEGTEALGAAREAVDQQGPHGSLAEGELLGSFNHLVVLGQNSSSLNRGVTAT
jgi:hypothetical protein